jgi:predicted protein tyrosine phosphatase
VITLRTCFEFIRAWKHDDDPLLSELVAGISRSMASALIALVLKTEIEAAKCIRAAPHAHRNRCIVEILGLESRLNATREAMGPADP